MPFIKEDKILAEEGHGAVKFVNEFPNRNQSLSSLNNLLKKIDKTGTIDC